MLSMLTILLPRLTLYNLIILIGCRHVNGNSTTASVTGGLVYVNKDNITTATAEKQLGFIDMGTFQTQKERGNDLSSSRDTQYTDNVLPTPRTRVDYSTTSFPTAMGLTAPGETTSTKESAIQFGSITTNSTSQELVSLMNLWNSSSYDNRHDSWNITGNWLEILNTTVNAGARVLDMQPNSSTAKTKQLEYSFDVTNNTVDSENVKDSDPEINSTSASLINAEEDNNDTQEIDAVTSIYPHTGSPQEQQEPTILDILLRDRSKEYLTEETNRELVYENATSASQLDHTSPIQDLQTTVSFKFVSVTPPARKKRTSTPQVPQTRVPHRQTPAEIRIAWLAPLGWNEGFSAESTVNVLKQAIIDSRRFLPHSAIR